jgi:hypothetical protein
MFIQRMDFRKANITRLNSFGIRAGISIYCSSFGFSVDFMPLYNPILQDTNLQGQFARKIYKSHQYTSVPILQVSRPLTNYREGTTCTTKVPHSIPGGVEDFSARFRGKMVCGGLILTESLFLKGLKFIPQKMIFIKKK